MIDNITQHHTPEGTTLELTPAGFVPRLGAWLIDLMIRVFILFVLSLVLSFFLKAGWGLWLILYFLIDWFYPVFFEIYKDGQTIGKKRFGIKVCQDDGMAITWRTSMIRNLLRVADFLPMMFVGAVLCMLFNQQNKRLGDLVSGTLVVYVSDAQKSTFDIPESVPVLPSLPLHFDEQQAILAFAERHDTLPTDRWYELAAILEPLTHEHQPMKSGEKIVGFANAIIGTGQSHPQGDAK